VAADRSVRLERAIDAAVVATCLAHLATVFDPRLLLGGAAATGGDTASHFPLAQHLVHDLLPHGRLLGWIQGNLAGFPAFQPYFPLPFLLMAVLAPATGLAVAFNLVTALGSLLLPLAAYGSLRLLGFSFPGPALGAVSTLPFLASSGQSVWGGNLLSTLSGEFAYSLGLAGALLFVGLAWHDACRRRPAGRSAALLAAVGLTHGYPWLFAGAASGSVLAAVRPGRALGFLARLHVSALALLAFWLAPALAYREAGTPYRDLWNLGSWRELLPPLLWPWAALAAGGALWELAAILGRRERPFGGATGPLWLGVGASFALYRAAYPLGLVDVRFLPFAQLAFVLLAAPVAAALARRLRGVPLVPLIALAATVLWVERDVGTARAWAVWNYSGFETKPGWSAFAELNGRLAGDVADARVAWEHAPAYEETGTIRAFESLPRFAGRNTLEGLYIQSSANSPALFYLQSEISRIGSCPFPDYHCSRLDPDRAAAHLELFNAPDVITRSAEARAAFQASELYQSRLVLEPYEVFRLAGYRPSYVEPLAWAPVLLEGDVPARRWREEAYRWFKRHGSEEVLLVRGGPAVPAEIRRLAVAVTALPDEVPRQPLEAAGVAASATLGSQSISLRTNRPGHPLLVKVSHHPRWRAADGSPLLEVAPSLMLVLPHSETLELAFATPAWMRAAGWLSAATLTVLAAAAWRRRGRAAHPPTFLVAVPGDGPTALARWGLAALAACVPLVALTWRPADPQRLLDLARAAERGQECAVAGNAYDRVIADAPSSYPALEARLEQARCAFAAQDWERSAQRFQRFVADYPDHPFSAEASERLVESLRKLKQTASG
jgi:hypothetical protein